MFGSNFNLIYIKLSIKYAIKYYLLYINTLASFRQSRQNNNGNYCRLFICSIKQIKHPKVLYLLMK